MPGAFGSTILFVCALAGFAIVASIALAYAVHVVVTVVAATASGQDEVIWAGETPLDWIPEVPPVVGLLVLCLAPAQILSAGLAHAFLPDAPGLRFLVLAAACLWLLFPVGLLSSLSGESPWMFLRPAALGRMLLQPRALVVFYAVSAVVGLAVGGAWLLAFWLGRPILAAVAAAVTASGVLLYSRLLGRLGWLASRATLVKPRRRRPVRRKPRRTRAEARDPWAAPPTPAAESKRPVKRPPDDSEEGLGYGLADEPPARPPQFRLIKGTYYLDVETPEAPAKPGVDPPARPPADSDEELPRMIDEELPPQRPAAPEFTRSRLEEEIAAGREEPRPPRHPLVTGVYSFPFYSTNVRPWLELCVGALAVGFAVGTLFLPAGGP
jgi:hypothetical protein